MTNGFDAPPKEEDATRPKKRYLERSATAGFGLLFLIASGILVIVLFTVSADIPSRACDTGKICWFDGTLLALVLVAGAVGAFIHAATSFSDYVGNRQLTYGWIWWFLLRIPIGSALGLIVYFAVRAGLFGGFEIEKAKDVYFVAALAALSGLFSKQAADKLSDVIDNLLLPARKSEREDPLREQKSDKITPTIELFTPETLTAKSTDLTLEITGTSFVEGAKVLVNDTERSTTFTSAEHLSCMLDSTDVATAGTLKIKVQNPSGRTSAEQDYKIT